MSERYTWKDVQRAADEFTRALNRNGYIVPTRLLVSPGSVTNGHGGGLWWEWPDNVSHDLRSVPGGMVLPRRARDAFENLTVRARMVDELEVFRR